MKKKIKFSDYLFQLLSNNGAKDIFLVPGGGNMHLVDAVKRNKKLRYVNFFHEQSAAIAAESYSRTKKKLGVALVTSGPGSTNAITGVAGAWIESTPLIIISGQVKTKDLKKKKKIRQFGPQEVDITKMTRSITKYCKTFTSKKNIIEKIRDSIGHCLSGRNGPIWLDIPLDIQSGLIKVKKNDLKKIKIKKQNFEIPVKKINSLINSSKKPLILAGHGIRLSDGKNEFKKFINKTKIPFITTWNSIDLIEYENKLNLGSPGVVARRNSNFAVQKCDLLISIGSSVNKILTAFNEKNFAKNAKKIIVDIDKNQLVNLHLKDSLKIKSDSRFFLKSLNKNIKINNQSNFNKWRSWCLSLKKEYENEIFKKSLNKRNIDHYYFTQKLSEILKENTVISTGSSGLGVEIFYTFFKCKKNQRVFLTSGLGAMGYGIPSAIGTCVSNDYKKIILVESDGSLMFNLQELATIRSKNLPIKIIILNNFGYASIRNTHKNYFNSRYVGTGIEDGIFYPNLNKIAKAFELEYILIKNKNNLSGQLKKSLTKSNASLIEIQLNKNETLMPKVQPFINKYGQIFSMPLEDMYPYISLKKLKAIMGENNLNKVSIKLRESQTKKI